MSDPTELLQNLKCDVMQVFLTAIRRHSNRLDLYLHNNASFVSWVIYDKLSRPEVREKLKNDTLDELYLSELAELNMPPIDIKHLRSIDPDCYQSLKKVLLSFLEDYEQGKY